jgi:Tfp pilus assembly PilM family ATPase
LALQAINRAQITTNLLPPRSVGVLDLLRMPLTERPAMSGWGLDLSVSGLKAVRLERKNEDELAITEVVHLPHRFALTHPEAAGIRKALLIETLQRFAADHPGGAAERVCVSWPAIQAFARFLRLPPVEGRKRRDMLQLEARQQIPMPLDLVAWDTFTFPLPSHATRLEPLYSVLLAVRRRDLEDHVALYAEAGIEVDVIQCDAAALHNYCYFERYAGQPEEGPEVTPTGILVADIGAELTNLIFSYRHGVWFRSVRPAGDDLVAGLVQRFKLTRDVAAQLAVNPARAKRMSDVHLENCTVFRKLAAQMTACHGEFQKGISLGTVRELVVVGGAGFTPGLVRFLRYGR